MVQRLIILGACLAPLCLPAPGHAQGYKPPKLSYGYQPYDDRNPTGLLHPNNMGYGRYVHNPRTTGRRALALKYRRFRGY